MQKDPRQLHPAPFVSTLTPFSLSIAVSAFHRACPIMKLPSLHLLNVSKQKRKSKVIKGKEFIKAKKQGQAEMLLCALKRDLAELG